MKKYKAADCSVGQPDPCLSRLRCVTLNSTSPLHSYGLRSLNTVSPPVLSPSSCFPRLH